MAPGALEKTAEETGARPRAVTGSIGAERTVALDVSGVVGGEVWLETGARSCPGRDWQEAPSSWEGAVGVSPEPLEKVVPPVGALAPSAPAGACAW